MKKFSLFLFFSTFLVYFITLSPTIGVADSAELITAGASLGIAHPSGYPLYVILGKLFTFLPIGDISFRINLMSAFFGAATNVVLFLIIVAILGAENKKNQFIALITTLIFAFTGTFWSQAVISEVYTLNTFLFTFGFYLLLNWSKTNKNKHLYIFSFIYGLSLTNHLMLGLLMPVYLIYIFTRDSSLFKKLKVLFICAFLFFLGLSVYLYLPLRSLQNPALDWGNPETFENFKNHVLRKSYQDYAFLANIEGKMIFVKVFLERLVYEFTLPLFIIGLIGAISLAFKKYWRFLFLSLTIIFTNSVLIIFLRKNGYSLFILKIYEVYFLIAYIIFSIWLGIAFNFLINLIDRKFFKYLFLFIIFLLPFVFIILNYTKNDQSKNYLAYDYTFQMLNSLDKNAVLVLDPIGSSRDTKIFTTVYFKIIENLRPDVTIIADSQTVKVPNNVYIHPASLFNVDEITPSTSKRLRALKIGLDYAKKTKRSLYTDFIIYPREIKKLYLEEISPEGNFAIKDNPFFDQKIYFRSNGIIYNVYEDVKEINYNFNNNFNFRGMNIRSVQEEMFGRDLISQIFYARAAYLLEIGQVELADKYAEKAVKFNDLSYDEDYINYLHHKEVLRACCRIPFRLKTMKSS